MRARKNPSPRATILFSIDDEPEQYSLVEMMDANDDNRELRRRLVAMRPGEETVFGGGGEAAFRIRAHAPMRKNPSTETDIPKHIVDIAYNAVHTALDEGQQDLQESINRNVDEQLEYWVDARWAEGDGSVDPDVEDLRARFIAHAVANAPAYEPDFDDVDPREEAELVADEAFDEALTEATYEALQDINSWQSWDAGGDISVAVGREFEVDFRETERTHSEKLAEWLAAFLHPDQAAKDIYEHMNYEGKHVVEYDVATALITQIDGDGDIHYEISSFSTIEPSLNIEAFTQTVRRILIENYPYLAKDEPTPRDEGAPPELVVDFSRASRSRLHPYEIVNLKTRQQLVDESADMRHCVGRANMGYDKAVARGQIQIWSLRTHGGKRKFTLEVTNDGRVVQFKGKPNNRRPGFDVGEKTFQSPDELAMVVDAVDELIERGLVTSPAETIDDLAPGMRAAGMIDETRIRKNPSHVPPPVRSFDEPWTDP